MVRVLPQCECCSADQPIPSATSQAAATPSLSPAGPISGETRPGTDGPAPLAQSQQHGWPPGSRPGALWLLPLCRCSGGRKDIKVAATWLLTTVVNDGTDQDPGPARASLRPPGEPIASQSPPTILGTGTRCSLTAGECHCGASLSQLRLTGREAGEGAVGLGSEGVAGSIGLRVSARSPPATPVHEFMHQPSNNFVRR